MAFILFIVFVVIFFYSMGTYVIKRDCINCGYKATEHQMKKFESYKDIRLFEEHGGNDLYRYKAHAMVFKCPKCSNDFAVKQD